MTAYAHCTLYYVYPLQRVKLKQVGFSVEGLYLGYPEHTLSTHRPLAYPLTWEASTLASHWSASDVTSRPWLPIGWP